MSCCLYHSISRSLGFLFSFAKRTKGQIKIKIKCCMISDTNFYFVLSSARYAESMIGSRRVEPSRSQPIVRSLSAAAGNFHRVLKCAIRNDVKTARDFAVSLRQCSSAKIIYQLSISQFDESRVGERSMKCFAVRNDTARLFPRLALPTVPRSAGIHRVKSPRADRAFVETDISRDSRIYRTCKSSLFPT